MSQKPSVGRIVHFHPASSHLPGLVPLPAIVTAVHEAGDDVMLTVFQPLNLPGFTKEPIPFAEEPTPGHWSWPPRS